MSTTSALAPPTETSSPRWSRPFGLRKIDVTSRDNNFYLVRLMLATRVIFGHAFVLGGIASENGTASFGNIYNSLGVNGFFVVSGFLVTRSLLSSRTMTDYVAARILRIVPALWLMLLISVPLVVLLGSAASPQTWTSAVEYTARNLSIVFVTYTIDGVFHGLPIAAVNGSIWSLRWEVACYVALAAFALIGLIRKRSLVLVATALLVIAAFALSRTPNLEFLANGVRVVSLFFFGTSLALYAENIFVSVKLGILGFFAAAIAAIISNIPYLVSFPFGYLLISIAYSNHRSLRCMSKAVKLRWLGKPDLSYGIFLYSFPIQQLIYYNRITTSPIINIFLTIVAASIFAYFSSEFVEKPAAALRRRVVQFARAPGPASRTSPQAES